MPVVRLVLEQVLAPVPGGTGRYALELARALPKVAPAGWSVKSVTAWHRSTGAAGVPGVEGPKRMPLGHRALTVAWERGSPLLWPGGDLVHATTPFAPPRRRRPVVVTVHDAVPWTHPQTLTPRGVAWHRSMIERAVHTADAIIVPSAAAREELVRFVGGAGRMQVIPNGTTVLPPPADAAARRAAFHLPERYLLSLATLEPRKGLDVLLQALGRLGPQGPALAVVGQSGWGDLDLPGAARSAGVAPEQLHMLGRLSDDDVAAVLAGAQALVVPSRAEGFGLQLLEAMGAGIPVIHSAAPALSEVAGGAGIEVAVGDPVALARAITDLWGDERARGQLAAAGLRRAADFSWASTARATMELYARLV